MGLKLHTRENSSYYQAVGSLKVNGRKQRIRKSLETSDPQEAHLKMLQLEQGILLGKVSIKPKSTSSNPTFHVVIKSFMADPSTASGRTARQILEKLNDCFGDMYVSDFVAADATQYVFENHTSLGHSASHTRRVITQLQSVLNYAKDQGFRSERITLRKPPEEEKEIVTLTQKEEEAIFRKLKPCNKRLASFILNTGARPAEAYNLRKSKLDFPRKKCVLTSIKGRNRKPRSRTIPLNPKAYAAAHGNQAAPLDQEGDMLFTYKVDNYHKPYNTEAGYSYFYNDWSDVCKSLGIKDKPPYTMRHTFGSRLGENNTPFAVISTLMGHTDPKTTMLYVHPEFEDHIKAVTSI
jgi:integrase